MRTERSRRVLIPLLVLASLAIWGTIGWHVAAGGEAAPLPVRPGASLPLPGGTSGATAPPGEAFNRRISRLRNPFAAPVSDKRKREAVLPGADRRKPAMPALQYSGFIRGPAGVLAMVGLPGEAPRMCLPGDTILEMRVLRIDPRALVISYRGQKFSVALQSRDTGNRTAVEEQP